MKLQKIQQPLEALLSGTPLLAISEQKVWSVQLLSPSTLIQSLHESSMDGRTSKTDLDQVRVKLSDVQTGAVLDDASISGLKLYGVQLTEQDFKPQRQAKPAKPVKASKGMVNASLLTNDQLWGSDSGVLLTA